MKKTSNNIDNYKIGHWRLFVLKYVWLKRTLTNIFQSQANKIATDNVAI